MKPLDRQTTNPDFVVRPYTRNDRDRVRWICCETGFLGKSIDQVFMDRDLFADFLTRYYTDMEPDTCWVGEKNGEVVSYLIGCKRWQFYRWWGIWNGLRLAIKTSWRFARGYYDAKSRKFLWWILTRAWRETPPSPPSSAHFHFNSLKGYRKMGIARDLLLTFFDDLRRHQIYRAYGQMATYDNRRTERVYEYMGWKVLNKKRISKYDGAVDQEIYLSTVLMELNP